MTAQQGDGHDVLRRAAEALLIAVRAAHGPTRHYPCDICDRADILRAALAAAALAADPQSPTGGGS